MACKCNKKSCCKGKCKSKKKKGNSSFIASWYADIEKAVRKKFRKKTYFEQLLDDIKRQRKKSRKLTRKFIALPVKKKEQLYKKLLRNPKFLEIVINCITLGVVFFIFYRKAKDPNFLSDL